MLSLPEDWNYSIRGLATISKEGVDAISGILHELEQFGYVQRNQLRNERGHIVDVEYIIYEEPPAQNPGTPDTENPDMDMPIADNSDSGYPGPEYPAQSNKKRENTKKQIKKNQVLIHSLPLPPQDGRKRE